MPMGPAPVHRAPGGVKEPDGDREGRHVSLNTEKGAATEDLSALFSSCHRSLLHARPGQRGRTLLLLLQLRSHAAGP